MDTNGTLNGIDSALLQVLPYRQNGVLLVKPKTIRNGIVLYAKVAASAGGHFYTVRKKHVGRFRYSYQCVCDGAFLGGYPLCRHVALFKLAEVEAGRDGLADPVGAEVVVR